MQSTRLLPILVPALTLAVSAPAQRVLRVHAGSAPSQQLGRAVAALGDVDQDGTPDYALAAVLSDAGVSTPIVEVRSGATGQRLHLLTGLSGDDFGRSVAGIDDLDGDGHPDLLVGAPTTPQASGSGDVRAFSGRTGLLIRRYASGTLHRFGYAVDSVGDLDGDGTPDFVTAAVGSARVALVSGRDGSVLRESLGGGDQSGRKGTVAAAGDIDGDGAIDYLAGNPVQSQNSTVWLYSGRTGAQLHVFDTVDQELIGTSVAGIDDVDGDGTPDFAAGAPNAPDPQTGARYGAVFVFSGATGAVLHRIYGPDVNSDDFGWSIAPCDDLDGDGRGDLVITARVGATWLVSGATGTLLLELFGDRDVSLNAVATRIHDVDGDGRREVLVGTPNYSSAANAQGAGMVLSASLLATVSSAPTQCGGGPWLPQLGSTRPILGRTVQIVGRDAPAGTNGILFLAAGHPRPFNLGVRGCDVFVDLGSAVQVPLPASGSWSLPVGIPDLPQLAGVRFALQTAHGPTDSRVGFDLSNGLLWFLGY